MQHYLLLIAGIIMLAIAGYFDRRRTFKPYANPQQSKLKTDLLTKQPILSPFAFWIAILSATRKSKDSIWPSRNAFNLYDEGVLVQMSGKTIQLSYKDIDYFRARGINDVVLHTKLEEPIAVAVKVNKYRDVLQLLASKGVTQKK